MGADFGASAVVLTSEVARRIDRLFDICHELEIWEYHRSKLRFFRQKVAIPISTPLRHAVVIEVLFYRQV